MKKMILILISFGILFYSCTTTNSTDPSSDSEDDDNSDSTSLDTYFIGKWTNTIFYSSVSQSSFYLTYTNAGDTNY